MTEEWWDRTKDPEPDEMIVEGFERLDKRVDEIHRLLGIGGPRYRPAETVPETKARLDRLKRNLL